jgi:hypothetical protein
MLVMNKWKQLLTRFNDNLVVRERERIPLRKPVAEEGDLVFPLQNMSWLRTMTDPVFAAAVAALADAPIDDAQLCFCCCEAPNMELIIVACCKQFIHWQCLLVYLGINSQCCYCHRAITNIATVLQYSTLIGHSLCLQHPSMAVH